MRKPKNESNRVAQKGEREKEELCVRLFLVCVVLSFFLFFLFFDVVERLHTDTTETVCTRKITTITYDLYIGDDDVCG